ncbi:hypothetical protein COO60DRAFT_1291001 [Scenedesmus sp. NREL 46B-D3]|nr:hypothetical protein COO60DRAFT_1291001 [Scenedesmus sp. NREL 46B-D3]
MCTHRIRLELFLQAAAAWQGPAIACVNYRNVHKQQCSRFGQRSLGCTVATRNIDSLVYVQPQLQQLTTAHGCWHGGCCAQPGQLLSTCHQRHLHWVISSACVLQQSSDSSSCSMHVGGWWALGMY